jgi:transcriptional regulator GlxA family with amidase domain
MLFIHSIRAHIGSQSEACKGGLLRAIFDRQIGVALKSMHEKVERPWTVESLAAACGMSRSAFALRFKDLVGETPLEYLTSWRMQKATKSQRGSLNFVHNPAWLPLFCTGLAFQGLTGA